MGDKKKKVEGKKSAKAKEEKKLKREARQTATYTMTKGEKRILNYKKGHGRHSKNGDK